MEKPDPEQFAWPTSLAEMDRRLSQRMDYLYQRQDEMDRRYGLHFDLNDKAIDKAERSMGLRLDSMNEFRESLNDLSARMATRSEMQTLDRTVETVRREKSNLDGKLAVIAFIVSVAVSVVTGLIMSVVNK